MVVAGFILLEVNTYSIGQGAQAQSFPIAILTLNPNEQKATQWRITETSHPVYLYLSNTDDLNNPLNPPPHVPIDIQVKDPTGQEVVSVSDSLKKFTKVVPSVQGDYSIYLTNKSNEDDAQIMIGGTYGKLPSTGQELLDIAGPAIAGAIMVLIGTNTNRGRRSVPR